MKIIVEDKVIEIDVDRFFDLTEDDVGSHLYDLLWDISPLLRVKGVVNTIRAINHYAPEGWWFGLEKGIVGWRQIEMSANVVEYNLKSLPDVKYLFIPTAIDGDRIREFRVVCSTRDITDLLLRLDYDFQGVDGNIRVPKRGTHYWLQSVSRLLFDDSSHLIHGGWVI